MVIGRNIVEIRLYKTIHDRLKGFSDLIKVPVDAIINYWLLNGIDIYWGLILQFIKEKDLSLEKENLNDHEFERFSELIHSLANEVLRTSDILQEVDNEIHSVEKNYDLSTIKEKMNFKGSFFNFIEKFNRYLNISKCSDESIDLKPIHEKICKIMNIYPARLELLTMEKLEVLNKLTNSELTSAIQRSIGEILKGKCNEL